MSPRRKALRAALLLLLLLPPGYFAWNLALLAEFRGRIEDLRAAGHAVTPADLLHAHSQGRRTALTALREAHEWLERHNEDFPEPGHLDDRPEWRAEDWDDGDWRTVYDYLDSLDPYYALVKEASQLPPGHARMLSHAPFDTEAHEIWWMWDAIANLRHRIEFSRDNSGITDRAIDVASIGLDLADRCHSPLHMGYLFRQALALVAIDVLRLASTKPGFDARRFRAALDSRLAELGSARTLPSSVIEEERAAWLPYFRGWMAGRQINLLDSGEDKVFSLWIAQPVVCRDAIHFLDMMERAQALCDLDTIESPTVEDLLGRAWPSRAQQHLGYLLTSSSVRAIVTLFNRHNEVLARARLARVALALLVFRQEKGGWPDRLDELQYLFPDGMPQDPFVNEPFAYERTDKGRRIYVRTAGYTSSLDTMGRERWLDLYEDDFVWSWDD